LAEGVTLVTVQVAGLFGVNVNVGLYNARVAAEPLPAHTNDGAADTVMGQEMELDVAPKESTTRILLMVTVAGLLAVMVPVVAPITYGVDVPDEIVYPGLDVKTVKLLEYG